VVFQPVDEGLSFEEQIVGAAKSIAAATAALVKAASVAQRELVSEGKVLLDLLCFYGVILGVLLVCIQGNSKSCELVG